MTKWILGALALVLIGVGIYMSQQSATEARRQAAAIVAADKAGQDTLLAQAQLKNYTALHMGSSVTLTLTGSLQRAKDAAQKAAAAAEAANSQIYAEATKACGGRRDSVTQAKCVGEYVSARLVAAPSPTPVPPPNQADFQRQFKSPVWSPDLAGALLLGGAASLLYSGYQLFGKNPLAFIRRRRY